ncbi:hypothetical protein BCR32DRAFT_135635 [Anaeromyces robustus]|uniref:Uncharacterized protein n=1 Tax=Anaeromyces robustus TaxID=1754192 RepID=A0A1Y1XEE2_9FUNG|nr:hypothetical protein BCR32DRAFT_135635 [Anaeromyces robustus]|eukprot:ORX84077.1 hypothetical protein BCR32DRAFT_135635 [Anaeromyces robustus]
MENYKKRVLNTVKFSFNDIPEFDECNKYNNIKVKKNIYDYNSKTDKSLVTLNNEIIDKKFKLPLENKVTEIGNEYIKHARDKILKTISLTNNNISTKKTSSRLLTSLANEKNNRKKCKNTFFSIYNKNNKKVTNNNISLDSNKKIKKNCKDNFFKQKSLDLNIGKDNLFNKKSLDLNIDLANLKSNNDSNCNKNIKEISSKLSNFDLNEFENNENFINNENRLSTITSRVKQLEQQLSITMKELREKNNIIYELKKEIKEKNILLKSTSNEK